VSYLFIVSSYLIGSINFAYLVAKYKKLDISSSGSGNPGTSNVMRIIGKKYAAIVLIGDVLKGFLPILLFSENMLICGLAAVIGHIYPIFYKFKGGKGVATYIGVYIAFSTLNPVSYDLFENSYFLFLNIPLLAAFYFVVFKISRISAIASLLTVFISNLILFFSFNVFQDRLIVFLLFWLIVFKHSENIKRLYKGKENKF
tara:strand:+ start:221 stop:823 length:603 start_codon:yes stop_codon:yes gene_type:complete